MKRKHTKQPAAQVPAPQPRREVARLSPDPEQGLTLHQVKERQQNGWANDPVDSPTKTVGQIVRENVFTFFNFIFVVLAALLVAVGSFDDMLFLLIAVANTGIGIVQQLRSKQTVDKLNLLAAPRAVIPKEDIISKVWGLESEAEDNNVEVYISFLRKKLAYLGSRVSIGTVRKVGYHLEVPGV